MRKCGLSLVVLLLFIAITLFVSCSSAPTKDQDKDRVAAIQNEEKKTRYSEYVIGVGDNLEIAVYKGKSEESIIGIGDTITITVYRKKRSEFVLGVGDTISISVYRQPTLKSSVQIDTSGVIMLPLIGNIQASGKLVGELRDDILQKLSKYLVDPQVAINVESRRKLIIDELSETEFKISAQKFGKIIFPLIGDVQAAGRYVNDLREEIQLRLSKYYVDPQVTIAVSPIEDLKVTDLSLTIVVGRSGKITIPLIGDVEAAGKGRFVLRDEIQQRLSKYIVHPEVTVNVSGTGSKTIYVLGEVNSPGAFTLNRRISTLEAISKAEGFTNDANQEAVLLVRAKDGQAEVVALNLDIQEMSEEGLPIQNVYLRNRDVIYVIPLKIVDAERFMQRVSRILAPILDIQRSVLMGATLYDIVMGKNVPTGVVY